VGLLCASRRVSYRKTLRVIIPHPRLGIQFVEERILCHSISLNRNTELIAKKREKFPLHQFSNTYANYCLMNFLEAVLPFSLNRMIYNDGLKSATSIFVLLLNEPCLINAPLMLYTLYKHLC